ncbi:MAG: alpha/beta hydrolase [Thermodesulfobacteriota bacterium]|nr:alpha/beta hydrolase [Thermodesulfobacteriota bacterium]
MEKETFFLVVDGLRIRGEYYIPKSTRRILYPGICLCHGIPGRIKDLKDRGYKLLAQKFCKEGFVVLIFNFRGAGESDGNFDISGWARDLTAVIDSFFKQPWVDKERISLMGFSGGAAVSMFVTAQDKRISHLVTCACPSEFNFINEPEKVALFINQARGIGIIREQTYPPSLKEWLAGFKKISPIRWVDKISPRPILIIHGSNDEVVDIGHAWKLYEKAKNPRDILIVDGASHRLRIHEEAMNGAIYWLKKVDSTSLDTHQKHP